MRAIHGAQALIQFQDEPYLLDTGNLLAVPAVVLRRSTGRLSSEERLVAESCIDFMVRGY